MFQHCSTVSTSLTLVSHMSGHLLCQLYTTVAKQCYTTHLLIGWAVATKTFPFDFAFNLKHRQCSTSATRISSISSKFVFLLCRNINHKYKPLHVFCKFPHESQSVIFHNSTKLVQSIHKLPHGAATTIFKLCKTLRGNANIIRVATE